MSIRKTINEKYLVDIYDKYSQRKRVRFTKLSDAKAYVNMIEQEKHDQKMVGFGLQRVRVSIADAIEEFMNLKKTLRLATVKKYKNIFYQFDLFTTNHNVIYVDQFTREHANRFNEALHSANSAPKTINHYLLAVKSLFEYQVNMDRLLKNPFDHIKLAREKTKSMVDRANDYYTEEEISNFFNQEMLQVYRDAFIGLLLTGCRFGELANLKWSDGVDFKRKILMIRSNEEFQTKTASSERDIPITNFLYSLLLEKKEENISEFIFPSITGMKLSERTLLSQCKLIASKAKIVKTATLHKWRHTFASHIERLGLSYEERQHLMGHSPTSMTSHYTKVNPLNLHKKLSELDLLITKNRAKEEDPTQ
ncbi:MAG: tyrosine-type recombinase/integrase [Melioribacteraceae bacterium]|jgi:integrase|nr:MAG: tyrosine-type recombinase/integrase [Melioribacteraceae bacterium]